MLGFLLSDPRTTAAAISAVAAFKALASDPDLIAAPASASAAPAAVASLFLMPMAIVGAQYWARRDEIDGQPLFVPCGTEPRIQTIHMRWHPLFAPPSWKTELPQLTHEDRSRLTQYVQRLREQDALVTELRVLELNGKGQSARALQLRLQLAAVETTRTDHPTAIRAGMHVISRPSGVGQEMVAELSQDATPAVMDTPAIGPAWRAILQRPGEPPTQIEDLTLPQLDVVAARQPSPWDPPSLYLLIAAVWESTVATLQQAIDGQLSDVAADDVRLMLQLGEDDSMAQLSLLYWAAGMPGMPLDRDRRRQLLHEAAHYVRTTQTEGQTEHGDVLGAMIQNAVNPPWVTSALNSLEHVPHSAEGSLPQPRLDRVNDDFNEYAATWTDYLDVDPAVFKLDHPVIAALAEDYQQNFWFREATDARVMRPRASQELSAQIAIAVNTYRLKTGVLGQDQDQNWHTFVRQVTFSFHTWARLHHPDPERRRAHPPIAMPYLSARSRQSLEDLILRHLSKDEAYQLYTQLQTDGRNRDFAALIEPILFPDGFSVAHEVVVSLQKQTAHQPVTPEEILHHLLRVLRKEDVPDSPALQHLSEQILSVARDNRWDRPTLVWLRTVAAADSALKSQKVQWLKTQILEGLDEISRDYPGRTPPDFLEIPVAIARQMEALRPKTSVVIPAEHLMVRVPPIKNK